MTDQPFLETFQQQQRNKTSAMQQQTVKRGRDWKNENTMTGEAFRGAALSRARNMSEQQALRTTATMTNVTKSDARIRLPQHHQVSPIAPALTIPAHALVATYQAHQLAHLQGLQNMRQHSFNVYRPKMPQEAIFKDKKLRSGKWTTEEEAYADILIELFVKGQVDLENGSTLRSFLAKKLHCAPMRVTKKYAGKSKGKASYLGKKNSVAIDPIGYQRNMTRLQTAKKDFLKAVYPELSVTHETTPLGVAPPIQPLIVPFIPNPTMNTTSWPQYHFPTSNFVVAANNATYTAVSAKPTVEISSRPSIAVIGPGNQSLVHLHPPHAPNADMKSQTLQESFLKAVQNTSMAQSKPTTLPALKSQQTKLLHDAYVTATEATVMQPPPTILPSITRTEPPTSQPVSNAPPQIPVTSHISSSGGVHQATEMPDFLKGFDKVTGMKKAKQPAHHLGPGTSEHHTPTFTSRSFDDCHRLLGQNISPIIAGRTTSGKPTNQSAPFLPEKDALQSESMVQHREIAMQTVGVGHLQQRWDVNAHKEEQTVVGNNINTDLLSQTFTEAMSRASSKKQATHHLGADYYNMFAQQTALVASQHSAYLGGPENEQGNESTSAATISNSKPAVVSEPPTTSGSDRGTEESDDFMGETTSGGSDTASSANDSDGTNSESSRKRRKTRASRSPSGKRIHRGPENQTIPPNN